MSENTQNKLIDIISTQVDKRRKALDLTMEHLAERAGISRNHLQGLKSGRREWRMFTLCRVAGALDCGVAELLNPGPSQEIDEEFLYESSKLADRLLTKRKVKVSTERYYSLIAEIYKLGFEKWQELKQVEITEQVGDLVVYKAVHKAAHK